MKRFSKIIALILSVSVLSCSAFATSASAATYSSGTKISGYSGNIYIGGGGKSIVSKGDVIPLNIVSSNGHEDNLSALKVSWNADPSEVSIIDKGYNKELDMFEITATVLKGGVTVPIYATVNGIILEADIAVVPDSNGIGSDTLPDGTKIYAYSDTNGNFKIKQNGFYTFMITCSGTPSLVPGSGSFKFISMVKSGNKYFLKYKAIGKTGATSGFYLHGVELPFAIATIV